MLAGDERWAMVQRIVSSALFAKAPQLRDILIYLARQALENAPAAISELELGRNVLGRRADFNPNEDNIVRVQVRHLRKKLEDYFDTEGRDEPVILTIPKGSYVPSFTPRPEPLPAPPAATDAAAMDASPRALAPDGRAVYGRSGNRWFRTAAGARLLL